VPLSVLSQITVWSLGIYGRLAQLSLHSHTFITPDKMITPTILDSGTLDSSLSTLNHILSQTRDEAQDCIL
jgi:hypothetical protein